MFELTKKNVNIAIVYISQFDILSAMCIRVDMHYLIKTVFCNPRIKPVLTINSSIIIHAVFKLFSFISNIIIINLDRIFWKISDEFINDVIMR